LTGREQLGARVLSRLVTAAAPRRRSRTRGSDACPPAGGSEPTRRRRPLTGGLELDDDRERIDVEAVHRYLSRESYWAQGKGLEEVRRSINGSARVIGLYDGANQVGFARVLSDGVRTAHLCDVYVLEPYRGRGLGVELVREAVDNGPHAKLAWTLATRDAYGLYERFGFLKPRERYMERPAAP
jgi:ribosomal protein S18 acetylase RimI-like enzyme